jgi:hypothetical protein
VIFGSAAVVLSSGCKWNFDPAMAKAVSRRPRTAEVRVRSQISLCGICGRQSIFGTGLYPITSVSPVGIIPPLLLARQLHTYPEGQTDGTCGFLSNVGEHGQKIAFTQV